MAARQSRPGHAILDDGCDSRRPRLGRNGNGRHPRLPGAKHEHGNPRPAPRGPRDLRPLRHGGRGHAERAVRPIRKAHVHHALHDAVAEVRWPMAHPSRLCRARRRSTTTVTQAPGRAPGKNGLTKRGGHGVSWIMRFLATVLFLTAMTVGAQDAAKKEGGHPAPKNLKVLKAEDIRPVMGAMKGALGQKCEFCHVEGDFASDQKHGKLVARTMIEMVNEVNAKFPDGKVHVSCYTCHRGKTEPDMVPPPAAPPAQ